MNSSKPLPSDPNLAHCNVGIQLQKWQCTTEWWMNIIEWMSWVLCNSENACRIFCFTVHVPEFYKTLRGWENRLISFNFNTAFDLITLATNTHSCFRNLSLEWPLSDAHAQVKKPHIKQLQTNNYAPSLIFFDIADCDCPLPLFLRPISVGYMCLEWPRAFSSDVFMFWISQVSVWQTYSVACLQWTIQLLNSSRTFQTDLYKDGWLEFFTLLLKVL